MCQGTPPPIYIPSTPPRDGNTVLKYKCCAVTLKVIFNVRNGACYDQSLYEAHILSHIWSLSWPHDIWPWMTLKVNQGNWVLMGCISWVVHVMTKVYMKHILSHIWYFSWPHDLWPWMTFIGQIDLLITCISWIVHVIIWICVNNKLIWLPGNYGSNFEQYLNWLQLDPISFLVNFSHELAHIMTTYDFVSAKQAILSNVWTDFNLTQFCFWSTFHMNWHI